MISPARPWVDFLVLTPSHFCDAQLAIAAVRAGALGILDLGFYTPPAQQRKALKQISTYVPEKHNWGVRWDVLGDPARSPANLKDLIKSPVPFLVLAGWESLCGDWAEGLRQASQVAAQVIAEVCSFPEAVAAREAGFAGLILKGHEAGGRTGVESAFLLLQDAAGKLTIPYWIQGGIGPHTAAAAFLAGVTGVVLGEQVWLAEEAPFDGAERLAWEKLDGSETVYLGD